MLCLVDQVGMLTIQKAILFQLLQVLNIIQFQTLMDKAKLFQEKEMPK